MPPSGTVPSAPVAPPSKPEGSLTLKQLEPLLLESRSTTQVITPEIAHLLQELSPKDAFTLFQQNPVAFMMDLMNAYFTLHVSAMQQGSEFQAAIHALQQHDPAFVHYLQPILQEVRSIVDKQGNPTDPEGDGLTDNWITLLLKAKANVEAKLQQGGGNNPTLSTETDSPKAKGVVLEGSKNTSPKEVKPSFTRQQIAQMSPAEYLKHEVAIKQALKEGRIK
jgi:hypothetical protein